MRQSGAPSLATNSSTSGICGPDELAVLGKDLLLIAMTQFQREHRLEGSARGAYAASSPAPYLYGLRTENLRPFRVGLWTCGAQVT